MYKYPNSKEFWNKSRCNPYNISNRLRCREDSGLNPSLAIPEKPNIKSVSYPQTSPFVNVEKLRTPIDNLYFEIYRYDERQDELPSGYHDSEYTSFKYQCYLPNDTFTDDGYYMVRFHAINNAGISQWSNFFILDLTLVKSNCYPTDVFYLDCEQGFCCSSTLVCE